MANTISTAFIAQYNADVKLAYQRSGLLRETVRKAVANGSTYIFQKIGKGIATDKARNGNVVPMNPTHNTVTATLVDKYAPEYIDKLDTIKENIDERGAMVTSAVMALQRFADDQILTVLNAATGTSSGGASTGFTMAKVANALYKVMFGANDVPDDGQVTGVISWQAYGEMVQLQQYSGFEYAGSDYPLLRGSGAVKWLNCLWVPHSGVSGNAVYSQSALYHKTSIGHAIGSEVQTSIDWIPEKVAWLIDAYLSMGAVEIDSTGIVPMPTATT